MRLFKDTDDLENCKFIQLPKLLFDCVFYREVLSNNAKLLYSILKDRMLLSKSNGWINEKGEIFLIFTREDVAKMLGVSTTTATLIFKELVDVELIKEVRMGLNRPNQIYLAHLETIISKNLIQKIFDSGIKKVYSQDLKKFISNYTESNNTDFSDTEIYGSRNHRGGYQNDSNYSQKVDESIETIKRIRTYFNKVFLSNYGYEYRDHKGRLSRKINLRIAEVLSDLNDSLTSPEEDLFELIDLYFANVPMKEGCTHNISHFLTDGILQNRKFEAGFGFRDI